jgi:NTE family protein
VRDYPVTLALQGGGSHGAFTWGVLDRLLEEPNIAIEGISGASAGAMNAVALAQGYMTGGREGARAALKDFWDSVAARSPFSNQNSTFFADSDITSQSALPVAMKPYISLMRYFSPRQLNPFDLNPLREIIATQIDFDRLRTESPIQLFIATTQVSSGTLKLFRNPQLSMDVLLASACLPMINKAVEIQGEAYWDGGLTANPPLFPLLYQCKAKNLIAILLQAQGSSQTPITAEQIWHRLSEMGFSSSFFTEMHALLQAKKQADSNWIGFGRLERRLRQLQLHTIESPELMSQLSVHSKMNAQAAFLHSLHQAGRVEADRWLKQDLLRSR